MMDFECSSKPNFKPWDLSSSSSSSVLEDHELVSSESTEEDDDYIAELTRQMAHYMLQDDHENKTTVTSHKNQELLGSAGWPPYSARWSPQGSSLEPTPPATPPVKDHSWHSCTYADVLKKLDKLNSPQGISTSTKLVAHDQNPEGGYCSKQAPAFDQTQDFQNLEAYDHKQFEANSYEQQQKRGGGCGGNSDNNGTRSRSPTQFRLPASNPWMNQKPGMKAVFLGGSGSKTGSSFGTGVFLPCVIGNTSQSSPKKRGMSPVLIPAKVVQALKVHFDRIGDLPRPNATDHLSIQNDALKGGRAASMQSSKKRHPRTTVPEMNHNDMGLPQEWTY